MRYASRNGMPFPVRQCGPKDHTAYSGPWRDRVANRRYGLRRNSSEDGRLTSQAIGWDRPPTLTYCEHLAPRVSVQPMKSTREGNAASTAIHLTLAEESAERQCAPASEPAGHQACTPINAGIEPTLSLPLSLPTMYGLIQESPIQPTDTRTSC